MSTKLEYVSSPVASDYKGQNSEAIDKAINLSKRSARFVSDKYHISTPDLNRFRYFETQLISTKDVAFSESSPSMLDNEFTEFCKTVPGRKYNVLRFDRKHNIKAFDFVLTYSQIADWGADKFNSAPVIKTFIGSMVFTGCSNIKDTETYENIPLEAHVRFESVGDGIGNDESIDGFGDNKGGPSFTFTYSYTKDYIYIFVSSVTPFRLVPKEDGSFVDFSYVEGRGSFVGEKRDNIVVKNNRVTGSTKSIPYVANKDIHFDLAISIKDTSIASTDSNFEIIDISSSEFDDNKSVIDTNAKTFTIRPTNGEVVTYGMTPSSDVDLEIASDVAPVKYNSRLLIEDMGKVEAFATKLEDLIKRSSTSVDKIPFVIKTSIRTRGKYNVRGRYFVDSASDSFGKIYITEIGTYDAKTDKFDITNRVFDDDVSSGGSTIKGFRKLAGANISPYLKSITKETPDIMYSSKSDRVLHHIRDISFEAPENLTVYSEVSFIRSTTEFECIKSFVEFGSENSYDDVVVYFNADKSVRVCKFLDYDMYSASIVYPFDSINLDECNRGLSTALKITDVSRVYEDDAYKYFVCTNLGLLAVLTITDYEKGLVSVEFKSAFRSDSKYATDETVTVVNSDSKYITFAGSKGNVSMYDIENKTFKYFATHLDPNEKVTALSYGTSYVVFVTTKRVVTYDLLNDSWVLDEDSVGIKRVDTRYNKNVLDINENTDFIPEYQGFESVPSIQIGNFRYYLGLRKDDCGYSPVYKKINLKTGEVDQLCKPVEEMYSAQLFTDGRYIYSIGGYKVRLDNTDQETLYAIATVNGNQILHDIVSPETIKDRIFKYDVVTDTWVDLPSTEFTLKTSVFDNDISENRKLVHCFPIIVDDKIYLFKPQVREFVHNEVGETVEHYACDNAVYVLSFTEDSISIEERRIGEIEGYNYTESSMCPFRYSDGKISLTFGSRNLKSETVDGQQVVSFGHYDFYFMDYDVSDNSFTIVDHVEIKDEYFDELYSRNYGDSKEDLLCESTICQTEKLLVAYAEHAFFIYNKDTKEVTFSPLYKEYEADTSLGIPLVKELSKCLLESNEYNVEWVSAKRDPNNVSLSDMGDGRILIVGGNAFRFPVILDVTNPSKITLYRTPTTVPRVANDKNSSVLGERNYSDYIRVISTPGAQCESIGIAERKNMVFAMLKQPGLPKPSVYYLDKSIDHHFIWMRDVNVFSNTEDRYFYDYKGCVIGQFAIFVPESLHEEGFDLSSGEADSLEILVYNALDKNDHRTILINEKTRKRVLLHSAICEQAVLLYETEDGIVKAFRMVYDPVSANIVTTSMNLVGSLDIDTLNVEWNGRDKSVISGGSYGSKSFVVSSNGLVVFDYDKLLMGQLSYKEIKNVFNDNCYSRSVTSDDNFVYVAGGSVGDGYVNQSSSMYKIAVEDIVNSDGYLPRERTTMNVCVSANMNPMYSSQDKLHVYGKVVKLADKCVSLPTVVEVSKDDIVYSDAGSIVNIGKITSSQYNRHAPTLHAMNIDGHQFLVAISGQQGVGTDLTKFVDLFDVARRRWILLPELPVVMKNVNFIGDTIVGATKVNDDSSESGYLHLVKLVCNDYSTLDFSWVDTQITSAPSSQQFVTAISSDGNTIVITGVDDSGSFLNQDGGTLVYTKGEDGFTYTSLGTIALNSQIDYKVIGLWYDDFGERVRLALYEVANNTIHLWKNSSIDGWTLALSKQIDGFKYDGGKRISFDRYVQGLNADSYSKEAYLYYPNDTEIKALLFNVNETIGNVLVKDLYSSYNRSGVKKNKDFVLGKTADLTSEGWLFEYDGSRNEYFGFVPSFGNCDQTTQFNVGPIANITSIGYDGTNVYTCNIENETNVFRKTDVLSGKTETICGEFPELGSLTDLCISGNVLAAIDKSNPDSGYPILIVDLSKSLMSKIMRYSEKIVTGVGVSGKWCYKLDDIVVLKLSLSYVDGTSEMRLIGYKVTDDGINTSVFDFAVYDSVIPVCIDELSGKLYAIKEQDNRSSLVVFGIEDGRVYKEAVYNDLENKVVISLTNGTFALLDKDKNSSCIKLARIDTFDKSNPLRYNDIVSEISWNVNVDPNEDVLGCVDNLYLPLYGIRINLFGDAHEYLLNKGDNKVVPYGNKLFHILKDVDGEENVTYTLNVYDKQFARKTVNSVSLYAGTEDPDSSSLDIPIESGVWFVDRIDNADYVYVYSKDGKIYKINSVSGTVVRYDSGYTFDTATLFVNKYAFHKTLFVINGMTIIEFNTKTNACAEKYAYSGEDYRFNNIVSIFDNGSMIIDGIEIESDTKIFAYIGPSGDTLSVSKNETFEDHKFDCKFVEYTKKYNRYFEKIETNGLKFDTFRTFDVNGTRVLQHIKTGIETVVLHSGTILWEAEAGGILFIGTGTSEHLDNIVAYAFDENNNDFVNRIIEVESGSELSKCVGTAVGLTTDRYVNVETAVAYENHVVMSNNYNTNKVYGFVVTYSSEYDSAIDAFDSFELKTTELYLFDGMSDDELHRTHLLKSRNNSVVLLGDTSATSRVILFDDKYEGAKRENFEFNREGKTLFVFNVMDTLYVGTTVSDINKTMIKVYELAISKNGTITRQVELGQMIIPKILVDINDVFVYSENDRMPSVESISAFCPVVLFVDTLIPVSEYNQEFIGTNYNFSSGKGTIKSMVPMAVEIDGSGNPVVSFVKNSDMTRVLKMAVNKRLFTNDYTEYYNAGEGYKKIVSTENAHVYSTNNDIVRYYLDRYSNTGAIQNDIVHIVRLGVKSIEIDNIDGTTSVYSGVDYPFNEDTIDSVSLYSKTESEPNRFVVFTDKYGNVSTYDRNLKVFVDVNGEISVDIPFFSSEIKIYPTKVNVEGQVAKRVWAFSQQNPYTDDNKSFTVDDNTLLTE